MTFGRAGVGIQHVRDVCYEFQSIVTIMIDDDDDLLTSARVSADNYDSASTRKSIEARFKAAFGGKAPYKWQIDVTEALILGIDCVVIAGTGAGKTMPFGMLALADDSKKKMVLIISPLNELECEQADRFKAMGLTATAVNSDVYTMKLHKVRYRYSELNIGSSCYRKSKRESTKSS